MYSHPQMWSSPVRVWQWVWWSPRWPLVWSRRWMKCRSRSRHWAAKVSAPCWSRTSTTHPYWPTVHQHSPTPLWKWCGQMHVSEISIQTTICGICLPPRGFSWSGLIAGRIWLFQSNIRSGPPPSRIKENSKKPTKWCRISY